MTDPVRCGLSFATVDELRQALSGRGSGLCFVPHPDEIPDGAPVVVQVAVAQLPVFELTGVVQGADFDVHGNIGVVVSLSEDSLEAIDDLGLERLAAPPAPVLLAPGSTVDGRFRIEAHLASGGMGDVYRANHIHLKRPVALKLLKRSLASDADMWSRFQREAELVSQLESPHVVRVFDFGRTDDGQPYIAMELVEGATLDAELRRGPLAPARAVEVLTQICDGLAEAHALGVIHRDLKPANLILGRRRDGVEVVKILDFGIARLADQHPDAGTAKLTRTGSVVGTPAYLAPEQALADELDVRTDVYALGCVAYELLTGRPPFVGDDLMKVVSAQISQTPEPLEAVRPELAALPALGAAVRKALAKDRAERYPSAQAFAAALVAALGSADPWAPAPPRASPPARPRVTLPLLEPVAGPAGPATPRPPPLEVASVDDLWPPPAEAGSSPAPAAPAPVAPPARAPVPLPVDEAALADFFGDRDGPPASAPPAAPVEAAAPREADPLSGLAPAGVLAALRRQRARDAKRAALAFVEVLGVPRDSAAGRACQAQVLTVAAAFGGFVDQLDEDGLMLGFAARARVPAPRAAAALLAMGEAVALEALRLGAAAKVRASLVAGEVRAVDGPRTASLERARGLLGRVQAGQVVVERSLAPELGELFEVAQAPTGEAVALAGRRAPPRRPAAPELVGRTAVLEMVDRRLQGLTQAGAASLVVRGPAGSGKSALLLEAVARARKRNLVPVVASAFPAWRRVPGSAAAGLICAALGVAFEARARALAPALDALKLAPPLAEAALVAAGVTQLPWAFSAGQLAHAVRTVLRATAGDRPVVVLLDGLEHLDDPSVELFAELASHPVARELLLGFTTAIHSSERLGAGAVTDLPALAAPELGRLVAGALGATPGPRLAALLAERAQGAPGPALDWLGLLEDRGSLKVSGAGVELDDDPPQVDAAGLTAARLQVLPVEVQRALEAAACQGETFGAAALGVAWPRLTPAVLQQAVSTRLLTALPAARFTFVGSRAQQAVRGSPSPEREAMHARLAQGLVAQGKANPASVDPLEAGQHFLLAGDGASAAALFQHAAEAALSRRGLRDVVTALQGLSAALGAIGQAELAPRRLEWLARAAGTALALQEGGVARALVDEGARVAASPPLESPELALALARVARSEARRTRAAEFLARAEALAGASPLRSLVDVERGEAKEQEGDLVGAMVAYEAALVGAEAAALLARWHGEVDLVARLEARLGALSLQRKDPAAARRLFESSARRWRSSGVPAAEARALSNLGTTAALGKDHPFAAKCFLGAAEAASRAGDLLFQARCLVQHAKTLKKLEGTVPSPLPAVRAAASEALKLATAVGWEMGRVEASALLAG
jgi:eukaryotic-like serine/threonine-protein kinase